MEPKYESWADTLASHVGVTWLSEQKTKNDTIWYEKTAFEIIHQLADGQASRAHRATGTASIGQTAAPYVPIAFYSRASLTPPPVLCT